MTDDRNRPDPMQKGTRDSLCRASASREPWPQRRITTAQLNEVFLYIRRIEAAYEAAEAKSKQQTALVDKYDAELTRVRTALDAAGIPDTEPVLDDVSRDRVRMVPAAERIRRLAAVRDDVVKYNVSCHGLAADALRAETEALRRLEIAREEAQQLRKEAHKPRFRQLDLAEVVFCVAVAFTAAWWMWIAVASMQ